MRIAIFITNWIGRLAISVGVMLALPVVAAAQPPVSQSITPLQFTLTDLGSLGGGFSLPTGIGSAGQVTGYSSTSPSGTREVAFLYEHGRMISLAGAARDHNSFGASVNASGEVVGYAYGTPVNTPFTSAFIYAQGKYAYPDSDAGSNSNATGINDAGEYIVVSNPAGTQTVLTTLYANGKATVLPSLGGDHQLYGSAINAQGHVTGTDTSSNGEVHTFLYADGRTTDIGHPPGMDFFTPAALNDLDEVIGTGTDGWYLYSSGTWTNIGTPIPPYTFFHQVSSINDGGAAVGYGGASIFSIHGFLYRNGRISDLNALTVGPLAKYVTVGGAVGINDAGEIAASGTDSRTGEMHAYLLTPTHAKYLVTVVTALPADLIGPGEGALTHGLSLRALVDDISMQDESLVNLTEVAGIDGSGRIFARGYAKQTGTPQLYALTPFAPGGTH